MIKYQNDLLHTKLMNYEDVVLNKAMKYSIKDELLTNVMSYQGDKVPG